MDRPATSDRRPAALVLQGRGQYSDYGSTIFLEDQTYWMDRGSGVDAFLEALAGELEERVLFTNKGRLPAPRKMAENVSRAVMSLWRGAPGKDTFAVLATVFPFARFPGGQCKDVPKVANGLLARELVPFVQTILETWYEELSYQRGQDGYWTKAFGS